MKKKRLIGAPITNREIEMQFGLNFPQVENNIISDGEIEKNQFFPEYKSDSQIDNNEWRLLQEK